MARLDDFGTRHVSVGTGYTVFVRLLKVLLPLGAIIIVGIVFARLSENPLHAVEAAARAKNDHTVPGQIEVVNARYEGADDKGHPYTLIAERARRADGDAAQKSELTNGRVLLDGLKADIFMEDNSWLAVTAKTGEYDIGGQHLNLTGNVSIFHDSGYEMHLEHLGVDLKKRHAVSKTPLHAQGGMGEISAQGLDVLDSGNRIIFAGPVKLTLYHLGGKG